jgi:hypothetical protein
MISKSHAGGRVATGRACHAGEVKCDDPDEKGFSATPGWGLSVVLTLHRVKFLTVENLLTISAGRELLTVKEAKVDDEVYRQ